MATAPSCVRQCARQPRRPAARSSSLAHRLERRSGSITSRRERAGSAGCAPRPGRCRARAGRRARPRRAGPTVAPCVHFTSSAKISSCGFVLICASSESSSVLFVCFASVFCASGRTRMRPLKTRARPAVEDALVELVARAVRHRVVDRRVVVDQLRRRRPGRGRSACSPRPRRRAPRRRRCARCGRRARRRATTNGSRRPSWNCVCPTWKAVGALALQPVVLERPRRRPTTISVTALVKSAGRSERRRSVSTTRAWLLRPATTSTRGCETAGARGHGRQEDQLDRLARRRRSSAIATSAPSSKNAVLSAANGRGRDVA